MGGSDISSIFRDSGLGGIFGAVILAVAVPIVLSFVVGKKKVKQRGVPVQVGGEPGLAMRNARASKLVEVPWEGATTMADLFEQSCKKHSKQRYLGTRKVIGREFVTANDGRKFEKLHLGDFQWDSYGEVFDRACNFASGLVNIGHDVETRVAIFAETRAEWWIAFQVIEETEISIAFLLLLCF